MTRCAVRTSSPALLALEIAISVHDGQLRKDGEPYINHVMRVQGRVVARGPGHSTVALLHDVVEDTPVTLKMLRALGFPRSVVKDVGYLTRQRGESYTAFIERIATSGSARAIHVKLADLADNMASPLKGADPRYMRRYRAADSRLRGVLSEMGE